MGEFFEKFGEDMRGSLKNVSRRKQWGIFFWKFGAGLRGFPKSNIGGRKRWGNFFQKIGEGLRGFPKCNICGRKRWGNFCRKLERVGMDFPRAILAVGNYGGIFLEIWRGFVWLSKKPYWREETMGENYS